MLLMTRNHFKQGDDEYSVEKDGKYFRVLLYTVLSEIPSVFLSFCLNFPFSDVLYFPTITYYSTSNVNNNPSLVHLLMLIISTLDR